MWILGSNIKYLGNFDKKLPDKDLSGGGSSGRGSVWLGVDNKTMRELNFNLENNPQQQTDGGNFEQIVPFRGRRNVNTTRGEADTNVPIDWSCKIAKSQNVPAW